MEQLPYHNHQPPQSANWTIDVLGTTAAARFSHHLTSNGKKIKNKKHACRDGTEGTPRSHYARLPLALSTQNILRSMSLCITGEHCAPKINSLYRLCVSGFSKCRIFFSKQHSGDTVAGSHCSEQLMFKFSIKTCIWRQDMKWAYVQVRRTATRRRDYTRECVRAASTHVTGLVTVSLKATFGFPITQGQLYSLSILWKQQTKQMQRRNTFQMMWKMHCRAWWLRYGWHFNWFKWPCLGLTQ